MIPINYIEINGFSLEYRWIGAPPGESPTLVFLHEGLGSVSFWRDFPDAVAKRTGLGALVYSRAGYGRSDPAALPRRKTFMHDEAHTLGALLAKMNIRDAILFGHSDGASIALIYSGMFRCRGIKMVILEGPHVFTEQMCFEQVERIRSVYETTDLRLKMERHHASNTDIAFYGWNDIWRSPEFTSWNIEELLPFINVPLLLIQGTGDEYGTLRQLDAIVRQVKGPAETLVIDKCGHWPHRDCPEKVLDAVGAFVRRSGIVTL